MHLRGDRYGVACQRRCLKLHADANPASTAAEPLRIPAQPSTIRALSIRPVAGWEPLKRQSCACPPDKAIRHRLPLASQWRCRPPLHRSYPWPTLPACWLTTTAYINRARRQSTSSPGRLQGNAPQWGIEASPHHQPVAWFGGATAADQYPWHMRPPGSKPTTAHRERFAHCPWGSTKGAADTASWLGG